MNADMNMKEGIASVYCGLLLLSSPEHSWPQETRIVTETPYISATTHSRCYECAFAAPLYAFVYLIIPPTP